MPIDPPIVPSPTALITPAIDAIVAARPTALAKFNGGGRYSHLAIGWRAQAALLLRRLADEAIAARLPLASGQPLRELARSEYETALDESPREAVGYVLLNRSSGSYPQDLIRAGTTWTKTDDPNAKPIALQGAQYVTDLPVYVAQGVTSVTVRIRATRPGVHANVVQNYAAASTAIQPDTGTISDSNWTVVVATAAGGSAGIQDDDIRRAADSFAGAQFGPVKGAVVAGACRARGVRYLAPLDNLPGSALAPYGVSQLYVADASWGSGSTFANEVSQIIADEFLGFGCRVFVGTVSNHFVNVAVTVRTKKTQDAFDTAAIQASIRAAVRSYFDDRPDWYVWKLSSLRAVVSRCDPKIQVCTSATVSDLTTNVSIADPIMPTSIFDSANGLIHYYLADNGLTVSVLPPT